MGDLNNTELYHHGIKGQKWGVRRSPEELGYKKRLSENKIRSMSDQELNQRINRLQREKQYKDLTRSAVSKVGKKIVEGIIIAAAFETAKAFAGKYATNGAKALESTIKKSIELRKS